MSEELNYQPIETKIASTVSELPPLKEGFVRAVHITHQRFIEKIQETGLDYEKHAMLSSVAHWWSDPDQVEYSTDDSRFSSPLLKALVFDIPNDVARLHNDVTKSPGILPSNYLVGIVPANQDKK